MFGKKNEKLETLKDLVGSREGYLDTVKMLELNKEEKDIFLLASIEVKKKKPNLDIVNEAYEVLVSKSGKDEEGNENTTINNEALKIVKEALGSSQQFMSTINKHNYAGDERAILSGAYESLKKESYDEDRINAAYEVLNKYAKSDIVTNSEPSQSSKDSNKDTSAKKSRTAQHFCSNCGNKLEDNVKFCSSCGTAIPGNSFEDNTPNQGNSFESNGNKLKQFIENIRSKITDLCSKCRISKPISKAKIKTTTHNRDIPNKEYEDDLFNAYIGNPYQVSRYKKVFDKFDNNGQKFKLSWNWYAFFGNFMFFLYRKQYLLAVIAIIPIVLSVLLPSFLGLEFLLSSLIFISGLSGVFANYFIYKKYLSLKNEIEFNYPQDEQAISAMQTRGGVHKIILWIGSAIVIGRLAYLTYSSILVHFEKSLYFADSSGLLETAPLLIGIILIIILVAQNSLSETIALSLNKLKIMTAVILIISLVYAFTSVASAPSNTSISRLQKRQGLYYEPKSTEPFTGYANEWYENSHAPKVRFKMKNGQENGLAEYWYENGQKKSEGNMKDGEYNGAATYWHKNGQKKLEGSYKNGKLDGSVKTWYENGQKKGESNYKKGESVGSATTWYENGQKKLETEEENSEHDASGVSWYENGQKESEMHYKNRERDGLFRHWYKNGQKKSLVNYKKDKAEGLATAWYENGQKKLEEHYKNDKLNGMKKEWYRDGKKKSMKSYKNGILVKVW